MSQIEIIKSGAVFSAEGNCFGYCGWPSVTIDKNGVLYVAYSGFRVRHICPFGKTVIQKSVDGGETWSPRTVINDTVLDDRDAGILSFADNGLLLTWFCNPYEFQTDSNRKEFAQKGDALSASDKLIKSMIEYCDENLSAEQKEGGSYTRISYDGGYTWSDRVIIPVSAPHGANILSDGTFLYLGKNAKTKEISSYHSKDGLVWEKRGEVPVPNGLLPDNIHEPHCLQLKDGRILGMIRVQNCSENRLPFPAFTVYQMYSDDCGRSWTKPVPTNFCGSPPHLFLHSSGAVVCSFGRRSEPFGERIAISCDNGKTWNEEILCNDVPSNDLGYPCSVELPDKTVITVYYQKSSKDAPASILYTKWRFKE